MEMSREDIWWVGELEVKAIRERDHDGGSAGSRKCFVHHDFFHYLEEERIPRSQLLPGLDGLGAGSLGWGLFLGLWKRRGAFHVANTHKRCWKNERFLGYHGVCRPSPIARSTGKAKLSQSNFSTRPRLHLAKPGTQGSPQHPLRHNDRLQPYPRIPRRRLKSPLPLLERKLPHDLHARPRP